MTDISQSITTKNNYLSAADNHRINTIFKIMQVPVIEYILYIIEESGFGKQLSYNEIFNLPPIADLESFPIILQEPSCLGNQYIHITFSIEKVDETREINYRTFIRDDTQYEYITSMINEGAQMVWKYFINDKIISSENRKLLDQINIDLDIDNLTFTPLVKTVNQQQLERLQNFQKKLIEFKMIPEKSTGATYGMLPPDKLNEFEIGEKKLSADIAEKERMISYEEEDQCIIMENHLKSLKRLVAQCSIVDKTDLPEEMQKIIDS